MNPLIQLRKATPRISGRAGLFRAFAAAQAVVPPPDGRYPGGNTAEGDNALLSLTSGEYNTAIGFFSLSADTTGIHNTAIGGWSACFSNYRRQQYCHWALERFIVIPSAGKNTATGVFALSL